MKNELPVLEIGEWVIRYREPDGDGPHPVIWLFHGWLGDEDSMWVFASQLPEHYLILAPRGPYSQERGGFGWYPEGKQGWPSVTDFVPAIDQVNELMENWPLTAPWADFDQFRLAGFSQGAAMAYSYTVRNLDRVQAVAGLAGFLPEDADNDLEQNDLGELTVYVSHGTRDKLVPIEKARSAVQRFDRAGAEVTFCESEVGHKLSRDCFKGLEVFFQT